jgi:hypothetical protein
MRFSSSSLQQNSEATCVNDKYFDYLVCSDSYEFSSSYEFENFLSQVHFLEKLDISCSKGGQLALQCPGCLQM